MILNRTQQQQQGREPWRDDKRTARKTTRQGEGWRGESGVQPQGTSGEESPAVACEEGGCRCCSPRPDRGLDRRVTSSSRSRSAASTMEGAPVVELPWKPWVGKGRRPRVEKGGVPWLAASEGPP